MTIELQAHGMRYELWLRRSANDGRSAVEHKALPLHVAEIVAAGNPAISTELERRGWVEVQPESKTMAEAAAELLYAATDALRLIDKINDGEVVATREKAKAVANLGCAINAYTDNVAPPEDKTETVNGQLVSVVVTQRFPLEFRFRAVLPDELDEDPELDADETDRQLYATKSHQMDTKAMLKQARRVLADVAEVAFTKAEDASAAVLEIQGLLRGDGSQPEGALDPSLAGSLRALLVCLDPDAADNLVEPFAVLERITVLVSELEARAADAEQSLSSAAEELGKETLARVSATKALREAQAVTARMLEEREAARRVVHAAVDLNSAYLAGRALALSQIATDANDAVHDWLDLQPESVATRATAEFIEKRLGIRASAPVDLPSPKVIATADAGWDFEAWANTPGAPVNVTTIPKPPSLPTDGYGNPLGAENSAGAKVMSAAMWALDKLFPKNERQSK